MKTKFIALLILVFLTSCGGDAAPSQRSEIVQNPNSAPNAPASETKSNERGGSAGEDKKVASDVVDIDASKTVTIPTERKIIRNADLNLEVSSPEDAQQKIAAITESKGGFVVESAQNNSSMDVTTRNIVTMTIRVPAAKFTESLDEIRKTSSRVIIETIKGEDVTEQFVDIEARLKAKKALEAQFLEIMKQGKTVQDALQIQRELANVRSEIEQIEGRKRFLENQASLSTIKVRLQTSTSISANPSGFFYQLGQSISTGFNFALNFILALVTILIGILPFLIFIVLPVLLLLRYFWRRLRTRKMVAIKEIIEEEIKEE